MLIENKRLRILLLSIIIITGFFLRLYSARVPYVEDELEKINLIKEINFDPGKVNLPLGSETTKNPVLLPYLMKASLVLFGENRFAARLPSVILGTLTLLFLYLLVKNSINQESAFLCVILLAISQFHIGYTRLAEEDGILLFFVTLTIFFVEHALLRKSKYFLFLMGIALGLGALVKVTILSFLPVLIFYIFVYSPNRKKFQLSNLFICLIPIGILILPSIFWNTQNNYANLRSYFFEEMDFLTFSLVPVSLFLGEIIVFGMHSFQDTFLNFICSYEYPFLNWLMGLICIAGSIYYLRRGKSNFIFFLLLVFYYYFILLSFVNPKLWSWDFIHLDSSWWGSIMVIPGFILGSAMLMDLSKRYRIINFAIVAVVVYLLINCFFVVSLPVSCFMRRNRIRSKEFLRAADDYKKQGKIKEADEIYNYIKRYYGDYS